MFGLDARDVRVIVAADGRQLRRQDVLPAGGDRRRAGAQGGPAGARRARPRRGLRHAQPPPRALPRAARRAARRHASWRAACGPGGTPARTPTPARTSPRRAAGRRSARTASTTSRSTRRCVYTHRPPAGAFRGYAATQAVWASRAVRRPAGRARSAPTRSSCGCSNVLRDGEALRTGEVLHDFRVAECLEDVAERIGWRRDRRGKGLCALMKGMQTPSRCEAAHRARRRALRRRARRPPRSARARSSRCPPLAAAALGVRARGGHDGAGRHRPRAVRHAHDVEPLDAHDGRRAGRRRARSCGRASPTQLEAAPGDLVLADGHAVECAACRRGGVRWPTSARSRGEGAWRVDGGLDPDTGQGIASAHWHQGAGAAEVRVDEETGPRRDRAPRGRGLRRAGSSTRVRAELQKRRLARDGPRQRALRVARLRRRPDRERQPLRLRRADLRRRAAARLRRCSSARARRCTGWARPRCRSCPPRVGNALRALGAGRRRTCRCTPRRVLRRGRRARRGARVRIAVELNGAAVRAGRPTPRSRCWTCCAAQGLASVRPTCGIGVCGACTVLVDDEPISSCLLLAPLAAGPSPDDAGGAGATTPCSAPSSGSAPSSADTVRPA